MSNRLPQDLAIPVDYTDLLNSPVKITESKKTNYFPATT